MEKTMLICATILILCVFLNKLSDKVKIPSYLIYVLLGFIFSKTGFIKYELNFDLISNIYLIAFIFIVFSGSISTSKFQNVKSRMKAILLATIGTVLTAFLIAIFCYYLLHFSFIESFLTGAILSPTDAMMVFSHLKNEKSNIENETIKILKFESASNDTFSYILILFGMTLFGVSKNSMIHFIFLKQILFGILFGIFVAKIINYILYKVKFNNKNTPQTIFLSFPFFIYSISSMFGGNGILSVYLLGYYINKNKFTIKISYFLEILFYIFQIIVFFILGMIITYENLTIVFRNVILLSLCLIFLIRPAVVYLILAPFKMKLKDIIIISVSGFRGISSIIFGIFVYSACYVFKESIFDTVIFTCIFASVVQNFLLKIFLDKVV